MQWLKLCGTVILIILICALLLPRLAQVEQLEIVRHNMENDIDATAYFYSDIEDFSRFEKGLTKNHKGNS
jgi:hypothetical protein